jgi:Protein of unknown function (DUF2637)
VNDRTIRILTAAAVLLVAAIAAVISFVHIEHLAATHGQITLAAYLLPLSIDGTVVAASMVMLRAARAGLGTPWLARVMLAASVGATLAANVAYGARFGLSGALLSGWPAAAFIGCAEMALGMVRRATRKATPEATVKAADQTSAKAPRPPAKARATGLDAAAKAAAQAMQQGQPVPSARELARTYHIGRDKAGEIRAAVLAGADGHGGQPGQLATTT